MSTGTGSLTALQKCGVLQQQVPLAEFTTWRVGGPAQWLAEPTNTEQIPTLLLWAKESGLPVHMIGAGSNLLIADSGLPGLTLCLRRLQGSALSAETGHVRAAAGEPLPTLADVLPKPSCKGWNGLWEFPALSAVPP